MTRRLNIISTILIGLTIACSPPPTDNETKSNQTALRTEKDSITKLDSLEKRQLIEDYHLNYIDTLTIGDVDGNGKKDLAFIQPYNLDSQYVNIAFSCDISSIKHFNGFSGLIANVGDLDGNKTEEIIYYPEWFQSNSAGIYIYGYKNNKWTLFGKGSIRRDKISGAKDPIAYLKQSVKKIDNKSFKLTEHIWHDTDIIDSTSIIIIQ
jgi:hypothetical protein